MVAVSDFSGLVSSACALASAAAKAPMVSLEWCMAVLHGAQQIKTDRPGFGPLGADAMAEGFLGILRHQDFEFGFGPFMVQEGRAGLAKYPRQFGPGIGRAHINDPHRRDPRSWWFDAIEARGLATLHTPPELLFRGQQQLLVEAIGGDCAFQPFAPAGDDRECRRL